MANLKIGLLAKRARTSATTVRYYEEIGLLRSADRQLGGHRVYGADDLRVLTFIRRCREFGFSIAQVRSLVELLRDPQRSCAQARNLAHDQLVAVRGKLAELKRLERSISGFVASCDALCVGGAASDCVILRDLNSLQAVTRRKEPGRRARGSSNRPAR